MNHYINVIRKKNCQIFVCVFFQNLYLEPKIFININAQISGHSGGPLFCNFRTRKSCKIRGPYFCILIQSMFPYTVNFAEISSYSRGPYFNKGPLIFVYWCIVCSLILLFQKMKILQNKGVTYKIRVHKIRGPL